MRFIKQRWRTLVFAAVTAVGAVCVSGCGGDDGGDDGSLNYGGKTYRTEVIDGKRWMAENLNYKPSSGGSWCYGDNDVNCNKYGRLYDWETARAVCPDGWRLPDRADWNGLVNAAGGSYTAGKKLKSKSDWKVRSDGSSGNGTDDFKFSAIPGGTRDPGGDFSFVGEFGYWWTATAEDDRGFVYMQGMGYIDDNVDERSSSDRIGFSVRCVK
ncbi:MAG: fibrobacter succinogenes major paralogous domain-containing protein [Chitinispirillales bacterium]|jgi:uncharacterized protein (TIGR02145 family)|nr:fibrobacter succinogenes major paralogous domain-containing protein [Chitinispirillales bacterium]